MFITRPYLLLLFSALFISGCEPRIQQAKKYAGILKDNIYNTGETVHDWVMEPPYKGVPHAVPDTYCYKAQTDILCYRQPMPGWEHRLISYQGTYAKAPNAATMELLAKPSIDESALPENKAASAKPVFTTLPTITKEKDKSSDQPQIMDSSHELLPDPAQANQL